MKSNICWINIFTSVNQDKKKRSDRFYNLAIKDAIEGADIRELEAAIKFYEAKEDFVACHGIKRALDKIKYETIINIKNGHEDD